MDRRVIRLRWGPRGTWRRIPVAGAEWTELPKEIPLYIRLCARNQLRERFFIYHAVFRHRRSRTFSAAIPARKVYMIMTRVRSCYKFTSIKFCCCRRVFENSAWQHTSRLINNLTIVITTTFKVHQRWPTLYRVIF